MEKLIIIPIILTILSCGTQKEIGGNNQGDSSTNTSVITSEFISIPTPRIYEDSLKYIDNSKLMRLVDVNNVPHDNTLLNSLTDTSSTVSVFKENYDGSISYLGNEVKAKNEWYQVIYDYRQTQTVFIDDKDVKQSIGISVRMIARIKTKTRNLDVSNLFNIGLAANAEQVEGFLSVRQVGISSQKVSQAIPVTADLSMASISAALQSVATIKSLIYDTETIITPYIIGFSIPIKGEESYDGTEIENFGL